MSSTPQHNSGDPDPIANPVQSNPLQFEAAKGVKRAQPVKLKSPFRDYQAHPILKFEQQADTSSSVECLKRLCDQILDQQLTALRQQNAKLESENQELRRLANTDALTQTANRRLFDQRLQQEWQRLMREHLWCSLILLDIDYFKRYNDVYGHQAGDKCLALVAQTIKTAIKRPADLLARYGGEEFAIILPNTDLAGAVAVADRIQTAIRTQAIPHKSSPVSDRLSVSMGITSQVPNRDSSTEMLVARADAALYTAKQSGRDRYYQYLDAMV
jgi:diguanylate cyclase (GGDEF)-like protein